jgi:hypothetical protein
MQLYGTGGNKTTQTFALCRFVGSRALLISPGFVSRLDRSKVRCEWLRSFDGGGSSS